MIKQLLCLVHAKMDISRAGETSAPVAGRQATPVPLGFRLWAKPEVTRSASKRRALWLCRITVVVKQGKWWRAKFWMAKRELLRANTTPAKKKPEF